jgi:hypothetical protein
MSTEDILKILPHLALAMPFIFVAIGLGYLYFTRPKGGLHPGE